MSDICKGGEKKLPASKKIPESYDQSTASATTNLIWYVSPQLTGAVAIKGVVKPSNCMTVGSVFWGAVNPSPLSI